MLEWIQSSGIAHVVQSSLWGYVIVLSSHAIGMAVLVGLTLVIYLRLLGIAPDVPLPPLRSLMRIALIGFAINLISGSMLFAADAYYFVGSWPFRIKFGLLLLSAVLLGITYRQLQEKNAEQLGPSDASVGKVIPALGIAVWFGVIVSGRLIAYL